MMAREEYATPSVIPDPETGFTPGDPPPEKIQAWWKAARCFKPLPDVIKTREDNGFLIVLAKTRLLYFLNHTARRAFLMMDGQKFISRIASELEGIYSVNKSDLESDLKALFYKLEQYGLIRLT